MQTILKLCTATIVSTAMAVAAVPAFAQDLLIEHVTVVDGTGRANLPDRSVLVKDGRIAQISENAITSEPKITRIDGAGKYLIPGLTDVHIHLRGARGSIAGDPGGKARPETIGRQALASYLYSGVTSVFDAGNMPDFIFHLRDEQRAGKIGAPHIYATGGFVTYPGSHGSGPGATLVDSWPQAIPLIDKHIARHPDMVKFTLEEHGWGSRPMIPILPVPLLQHLVEYFNDHGVRTTVHTSSELRARQAIFAGVDTLAHPVIQGPITDSFATLMAMKQIPMASTLTIGENYARLAEHPEYLDQPLYRASLSPEEINELKTKRSQQYRDRTWTWWMKIMTPIAQENVRKIHDAGGVIALGTDQTSGPAVHREMELLVDAGISPAEVIRIATLNSAVFLGKQNDYGSIERGKVADLVLLNADPTADINNAKDIDKVIFGGKVVDREHLDLAGILP